MSLTPEQKLRKRTRMQQWRAANRARLATYNKQWREQNPEKRLAYDRKYRDKRHTPENAPIKAAYERERLKRQYEAAAGRPKPDRCEVCGGTDGGIAFDHCHQRGIFRGWICAFCNTILGLAKDDPNRLLMLVAYLERTKGLTPPQLVLPGL